MVLKQHVMTPTHFIFNMIALCCQIVFFFNELVQMAAKGKRLSEYFDEIWNFNDMMLFPTYLTLSMMIWISTYGENSKDNFTPTFVTALKIVYLVVVVQTFVKFMFLVRIYPQIGFILSAVSTIIVDLVPFIFFCLCCHGLFGLLYVILDIDVGDEYQNVWAPIKFFAYSLRTSLLDF